LKNTSVRTSNLARIIYKILLIYTAILQTVVRKFTHRNVCSENHRRRRRRTKKKEEGEEEEEDEDEEERRIELDEICISDFIIT